MAPDRASAESRVLLVAPRGRDHSLLAGALGKATIPTRALPTIGELVQELGLGAGAILLEEEAFDSGAQPLIERLKSQPPWSDLPVIVLTSQSRLERETQSVVTSLGAQANLVLLERPIRILTLLQTVRSALRARHRQYEVRDFQKTLEAKVAERTVQLESALLEMNAFSYTIAHDLRAPLRSVHRFGEIVETDYGTHTSLGEEGLGYIRQIRAEAARMDRLIQDLLHYSRLTRVDVALSRVDVRPLVDVVLKEMALEIKERQGCVESDGAVDAVLADRILLAQALTNLVSNALKFVAPGIRPRVLVRTERRDSWTRIWVEDNGIGIAPRHHSRIFEVFERLQGQEYYAGTGIGLAIVRRVVERQGGQAGVDSEQGRGSRFWIDLRSA